MLPDRVSNPGPLTYESGALPIAQPHGRLTLTDDVALTRVVFSTRRVSTDVA